MQGQIAQLEAENQGLRDENSNLTQERTQLQGQNAQLVTEKTQITAEREKYKSVAQRLQASNITIQTTKKRWIDKKEIKTDKAKSVENIKIGFNILKES